MTALAPLRADAVPELRAHLARIGQDVEDIPEFPITALRTTHFFRMLVIDGHLDLPKDLAPHLLFTTVFDGSLENHFSDLMATLGAPLTRIFTACRDFDPGTDLTVYIRDHLIVHDLLHVGAVRASVQDIRDEARLVASLQVFMDDRVRAGAWNNVSPSDIRRDCLAFVRAHPDLPQGARPVRPFLSQVLQFASLLVRLLLLATPFALVSLAIPWGRQSLAHWLGLTLLLMAAAFVLGILGIRLLEIFEKDDVPQVEPDTEAVEALEDFQVQNQFTMLAPIRASIARRLLIAVMLWFGNTLSEQLWNRGKLVGVDTIHFARMYRLFDRRYLLFMSDYDGSWRRYLGDFLTVGSFAVIPIWSHLKGCPKTFFFYWTTRGFEPRFLRFTRTYQLPTELWYSAYQNLTMADVLRAARIRAGLFTATSDRDIQNWLREL